MYKIIDGNSIANKILSNYKDNVFKLKSKGHNIVLCDIQVGLDEASSIYINNKKKKFEEVDIEFKIIKFDEDISETELIDNIYKLNIDDNINGIFVELPLPKHINEKKVIDAINPKKDVDGFNVDNIGAMTQGLPGFFPCTAEGIVELLKESNITLIGKHVVVVGRSNIVGKPVSILLLKEDATVTICHSKTKNLEEICKTADILVVAIGKAKFIDEKYIKEGTVVIDAGIHREICDGVKKVCGDVDFDKVAPHTSYITPVPGGVGPMTITRLIEHCIRTVNE